MYTYNLLCFGLDPQQISRKDREILNEIDFTLTSSQGYEMRSHYHGGANIQPYTIGCIIGDDTKPNFIHFVRSLQEADYQAEYEIFKEKAITQLSIVIAEEVISETASDLTTNFQKQIVAALTSLKELFETTKPNFHIVQVSS